MFYPSLNYYSSTQYDLTSRTRDQATYSCIHHDMYTIYKKDEYRTNYISSSGAGYLLFFFNKKTHTRLVMYLYYYCYDHCSLRLPTADVKQVSCIFFLCSIRQQSIIYFLTGVEQTVELNEEEKKSQGEKNVLFLLPPPPLRWCVNRTLIMDCLGHYCRTLSVLIWLHLSYRDQYTTRRADHFSHPAIVSSVAHSIRRKTL